jgi:hypothetical protein
MGASVPNYRGKEWAEKIVMNFGIKHDLNLENNNLISSNSTNITTVLIHIIDPTACNKSSSTILMEWT